jgi:hypothetical protein
LNFLLQNYESDKNETGYWDRKFLPYSRAAYFICYKKLSFGKMRLMLKRNLHYILLLLLIADSVYFFCQFYHTQLDGDMASVILAKGWCNIVMNDPLGLNVLLHNKYYGGTNRFFAHWFMSKYFKTMPFLLQHFVNPIDSAYLSCALIKTVVELFIIFLLASFISLPSTTFKKEFLMAAVLIAP